MALLLTATFQDKYVATPVDLTERSPLRLSESDSCESPGYGQRFVISRPYDGYSQKKPQIIGGGKGER